jgi:LEA14-like dessication related protein
LIFETITAEDPDHLTLVFSVEIKNPVPSNGRAAVKEWRLLINGQAAEAGFTVEFPESVNVAASSSASFPLVLNLDMAAVTAAGIVPAEHYRVVPGADLDFSFDTAESANVPVSGAAEFPRIQAPVFSITSIAILKAELVNTRFRVGIKIDNPNPCPGELSAFVYELYGNGRLWADGTERNVIRVPAKSSIAGNLFLMMNFINMKRDLLDQIIRLEDVNYRFAGEASVGTSVEYLPKFLTAFDLSGYSRVFEN